MTRYLRIVYLVSELWLRKNWLRLQCWLFCRPSMQLDGADGSQIVQAEAFALLVAVLYAYAFIWSVMP